MEYPTVIDLTLYTPPLVDRIQDWQTIPDLGSDHYGILFNIITSTSPSTSSSTRFDTKSADWECFRREITSKAISSSIKTQIDELIALSVSSEISKNPLLVKIRKSDLHQKLDQLADDFTTLVIDASTAAIPKSVTSVKSKPWWNENLRNLRKSISYFSRKSKKDPSYA